MIISADGDAVLFTVLLRLSGCYSKLANLPTAPAMLPMTLLRIQNASVPQLEILTNDSAWTCKNHSTSFVQR